MLGSCCFFSSPPHVRPRAERAQAPHPLPQQTREVKIDNRLPPPPNFVPPPPEVIDLTIDFDGTLLWNKSPVDRKTLQGYIETEAQKDPQPEVHITVDKFV